MFSAYSYHILHYRKHHPRPKMINQLHILICMFDSTVLHTSIGFAAGVKIQYFNHCWCVIALVQHSLHRRCCNIVIKSSKTQTHSFEENTCNIVTIRYPLVFPQIFNQNLTVCIEEINDPSISYICIYIYIWIKNHHGLQTTTNGHIFIANPPARGIILSD